MIEKASKTVFIVDPEEEGLKYLKLRYRQKGIMFIQRFNIEHELFKKSLEKALASGSLVFIEIEGIDYPEIIKQLVTPVIRKHESHGNL